MRNGFVRVELDSSVWEVPERYQNLRRVGAGTFGQVCKAFDLTRKQQVAIKKLSRPFQSAEHAKRTYRELRLLRHMNHDNVIGLFDVFTPSENIDDFQDVYLVTHLMDADLSRIDKSQFTIDHVLFLIYQILRGLKYIHSAGIIHRDLKPSNLGVDFDSQLKILDFGLARRAEAEMTGYVSTRWYRAPEIMWSWMHYNQTADIWSVGCIMAELMTSEILFPGTHTEQLRRIMDLCGTPDDNLMQKISSEEVKNYIRTLPQMKRKNFQEYFEGADSEAIDLLEKMLELDPDKRPTAEEALAHSCFSEYSDPDDEPIADNYDASFEDTERTLMEWKAMAYNEVVNFIPFN